MLKRKLVAGVVISSVLISLVGCRGKSSDERITQEGTVVIGVDSIEADYNPFFSEDKFSDSLDDKLAQISLVSVDRNGNYILEGIEGYVSTYNGTEYTYYTPSQIDYVENEDGTVSYNITIRDDIKFSDGDPLTIDDVIFSMYVMCDKDYDGNSIFSSLPIVGLDEYQKGNSDNIAGIERVDDYSMVFTLSQYSAATAEALSFSIVPLHYYGDASLYDYAHNKFGFEKGNLSSIREKTGSTVGAGPFQLVEESDGTLSFEANENYYLGAPLISDIQVVEIQDEDKAQLVADGTIDLVYDSMSEALVDELDELQSQDNATIAATDSVRMLGYGYIGMNPYIIKVGDDAFSRESECLRTAIATVISAYREEAVDEYYGDYGSVVNYPISTLSWATPNEGDENYEVAYSRDIYGDDLYDEEMDYEEVTQSALVAAMGYFGVAGYEVEDDMLVEAPEGASFSCEVWIAKSDKDSNPMYEILENASEALAEIGFTLDIKEVSDKQALLACVKTQDVPIWCGEWMTTPNADIYRLFHSEGDLSSIYGLNIEDLDFLIENSRYTDDVAFRKGIYKQCFNYIMDAAVEIPVYQRQNVLLYSSESVDGTSITTDMSPYYDWTDEIWNLQMID